MKVQEKETSPIFNAVYKGIPIKSDSRVHFAVLDVLQKTALPLNGKTVMDVATGNGALAQRLIDHFQGIIIDCNDLDHNVMAVGVRNIFFTDLNSDFDFGHKYDIVLAVEIIEHLENPFQFLRSLQRHLNPGGFVILTTPNVDSFFDRLWFFLKGYPLYFGSCGIINSGGHITMCPEWLLRHIAEKQGMEFSLVSDYVDSRGLIGWKARLILSLLSPLRVFIKNDNNRSGTVCIFKNKERQD
jgi:SAM-dependent methyltransferase